MSTAKRSTPSILRLSGSAALAAVLGFGIAGCDGLVEGDVSTTEGTGPGFERVSDARGDVTGVVQTTNGAPLAGARVFVAGQTTTTNEAGQFYVSGVPVTNSVGADGAIAQTIPVSILPVSGGNYLSASAVVNPQAQFDGSEAAAGTGDTRVNPQTTFVDGYVANTGVIVIPELNSSAEFVTRSTLTGELVGGVNLFADFTGLTTTTVAGGGVAVTLESELLSGTTDASGEATISGMADDATYVVSSNNFSLDQLQVDTPFAASPSITGTLASGTVAIATNYETAPVLICDLFVTPKASSDERAPFVTQLKDVVYEFTTGNYNPTDSVLDTTSYTSRAMLESNVVNDITVSFSEPMAATADDEGATLLIDLGSDSDDSIIQVVDHTAALSADGEMLTLTADSDLSLERKYDIVLMSSFFTDVAGNSLTDGPQDYEGDFATTTDHPLQGTGLAFKTYTTLSLDAQVPSLAQVCTGGTYTDPNGLVDVTPTFDDLRAGTFTVAGIPAIANLNADYGDDDANNFNLPQYLGQSLADAIIDETSAQGANVRVNWQSADVVVTRTDEKFSSVLLQYFRGDVAFRLRDVPGVGAGTKALGNNLEQNVNNLAGQIQILNGETGEDITSQVSQGDASNPSTGGSTGATGVTGKINLANPENYLVLTFPANVDSLVVRFNQTSNLAAANGTDATATGFRAKVGDRVEIVATNDLGAISPDNRTVTFADCVAPNLALQRSYCLTDTDGRVTTETAGGLFGNGVELIGETATTGDVRIVGYKTPELLDVEIDGTTDGTLNQELYANMPEATGFTDAANSPVGETATQNGVYDADRYDDWLAEATAYQVGFEFTERVQLVGQPTHSAGQLTNFVEVNPDADGFTQPTGAEFPGASYDPDDSYLVSSTITGTSSFFDFLHEEGDEVFFAGTVEDKASLRNDATAAADINTLLLHELVPPFVERAREDGTYVWVRFNEPVTRENSSLFWTCGGVNTGAATFINTQADIDAGDSAVLLDGSATAESGTVARIPVGRFAGYVRTNCFVNDDTLDSYYAEDGSDFDYPTTAAAHARLNISGVEDLQGNSWAAWEANRGNCNAGENGVNSPDFYVIDDLGPFITSQTANGTYSASATNPDQATFVWTATHPINNLFTTDDFENGAAEAGRTLLPGMANCIGIATAADIPAGAITRTSGGCNANLIANDFALNGAQLADANIDSLSVTISSDRRSITVVVNFVNNAVANDRFGFWEASNFNTAAYSSVPGQDSQVLGEVLASN